MSLVCRAGIQGEKALAWRVCMSGSVDCATWLLPSPPSCAQGAVAACGAPIVGWLAERLGFDSSDSPGGADADIKRAKALGVRERRGTLISGRQGRECGRGVGRLVNFGVDVCAGMDRQGRGLPHVPSRLAPCQDAVVICTAVPWALCCLLYSGLHVTYPRCGARALMPAWPLRESRPCFDRERTSLGPGLEGSQRLHCGAHATTHGAPSLHTLSPPTSQRPPPGDAHAAHALGLRALPARHAAPALRRVVGGHSS